MAGSNFKQLNVLDKILKELSIPIVTTWSGVDGVDHYNKNFIGTAGFMEQDQPTLLFKIVIC